MLFALRFAQVKKAFREAELKSILETLQIPKREHTTFKDSPFLIVDLPDTESVINIIKRSTLLLDIYRLFALNQSLSDLQNTVSLIDFTNYADLPFRFHIDSFMKTFTENEQLEMINSFSFLPLKGPVRLNDDMAITFSILHDHNHSIWMFGERINANKTMRSQIDVFSLKKRHYLGTTSMEAELGFIMANLARVKVGSLIYDPFVGTGSLLLASAHFGGLAFGSDIDGRQLRGGRADINGKGSLHSNIVQYGMQNRVLGGLVFDICQHPWRHTVKFDAIITDPPYGVRAGAKKIAKTKDRHVPAHLRSVLYPTTAPYEMDELARDLLSFAASFLVSGGRLVFWYPQELSLANVDPSSMFCNSQLVFKYSIPQQLRMFRRWLLIYEKK